jgi:thiamine-phosphate diphosphorylase
MSFQIPKLYPITDRRISGLSHSEQVARLIEGGATFIQLREKNLSPREFYLEAEAALKIARAHHVNIIINDRADIALALKADGVHLGQDDLKPRAAREVLGDRAIIGYSTHTFAQVQEAIRMPVDYIAFGPIFATSSKEKPEQTVGLENLSLVREQLNARVPLVAIGGINENNAVDTIRAGADSIAVISVLLKNPSKIAERTRELQTRLAENM